MKRICMAAVLAVLLLLTACAEKKNAEESAAVPSKTADEKKATDSKDSPAKPVSSPNYIFSFDPSDKDAVSKSSGTGGTEWLGQEDYSKYFKEIYNKFNGEAGAKPPIEAPGFEFANAVRVVGMEDKSVMDKLNQFIINAEKSLIKSGKKKAVSATGELKMIREIYSISGVALSLKVYSIGTSVENGKSFDAVFNIRTGEQYGLSDLFYDGFNYIDYINREIVRQLSVRMAYDFDYDTAGDEFIQKRAFSGIPRDYPYYELHENGLTIRFDQGNPFFSGSYYGNGGVSFAIELTKDVSPYGKEPEIKFAADYTRVKLSDSVTILKPLISDFTEDAVQDTINSAVSGLVDEIGKDKAANSTIKAFMVRGDLTELTIQPEISEWKNYLCVSFVLDLFGGPYENPPLIGVLSFDLRSGKEVDLAKVIPKNFDWSKAMLLQKAVSGEDGFKAVHQEPDPEPIQPQNLENGRIRYHNYLNVDFELPDGSEGTAVIPLTELEQENSK